MRTFLVVLVLALGLALITFASGPGGAHSQKTAPAHRPDLVNIRPGPTVLKNNTNSSRHASVATGGGVTIAPSNNNGMGYAGLNFVESGG